MTENKYNSTDCTIKIQSAIQHYRQPLRQSIQQSLHTDSPLLDVIISHVTTHSGKQLRSLVVLSMAQIGGLPDLDPSALETATIIELIHLASLLHDDVIDTSDRRRGQASANAIWDNTASVLAGDFLYSRACQLLAQMGSQPLQLIISAAANRLTEGELLQLEYRGNSLITLEQYETIISAKTAALFAAASQSGAAIAQATAPQQQYAYDYGYHLGMAFQIIDDCLDYSNLDTGKRQGDDLAEGKMTLPLILAAQHSQSVKERIQAILALTDPRAALTETKQLIAESEAIPKCLAQAKKHIEKAQRSLQYLPDHPSRTRLLDLLEFSWQRQY